MLATWVGPVGPVAMVGLDRPLRGAPGYGTFPTKDGGYVAIGINLLTMIWAATQGASIFSGLLGFVLPGIVVALLLNQQSKQYYASRGISY